MQTPTFPSLLHVLTSFVFIFRSLPQKKKILRLIFLQQKPIEENLVLDFFFPDYINKIIKRAEFVNKLIDGSPANPIR